MKEENQKLTKLTQTELDVVLAKHETFLLGRSNGIQAKLSRYDLSHLIMRERNLSNIDFSGSVLYGVDFEKSKLDFCSFFSCDLRKTNFRDASLVKADLRGATFRGAIMIGADLSGADMREGSYATFDPKEGLSFLQQGEAWAEGAGGVDLRGASMVAVKMAGAVAINSNFTEANLSKARFSGGVLRSVNLSGANLAGADLSKCELIDVNMKGANLTGALIDYVSLKNIDMTDVLTDKPMGKTIKDLSMSLEQMIELHGQWLKTLGEEGGRLDLSAFDLREVLVLSRVDLTMLIAENAVLYGLDFSHSQLQASRLSKSDLRNCNFQSADLRGSDFSKTKLSGARMGRARFDPLILPDSRQLNSTFANAELRYIDFSGADLRGVDFSNADLSYANFTNANIKDALFKDALLVETRIDLSLITGSKSF